MPSLFKSTVLGLGLVAGVALTAHAQSVSALPPTSPATAPTATAPAYSSAKIYPNPGNNSTWQEEHHQSTASTSKIYPNPGNNSTWQEEHYQGPAADSEPARHPYSVQFGPKPN
jgi:hypothetical protein